MKDILKKKKKNQRKYFKYNKEMVLNAKRQPSSNIRTKKFKFYLTITAMLM